MTIKAGETATLYVSDTPKITDTLIEIFKIDMETQKDNPQGNSNIERNEVKQYGNEICRARYGTVFWNS